MPEIIAGFNTEQKVVTVSNEDVDINAEINTQAADNWLVSSIIMYTNDTWVLILFTRTVTAAA